MRCSQCRKEAVIFQSYSGKHLCRDHFLIDFEAKAKRLIRQNQWMRPGDHITILLEGGPADYALLVFFRRLAGNRRDVRVSGVDIPATGSDPAAYARDCGATKMARATPLEDTAAGALTDILRGCPDDSTLLVDPTSDDAIPVITPFCHIPAAEIEMYAGIHGFTGAEKLPDAYDPTLLNDVKHLMAEYTERHPAAPHAILRFCESVRTCQGDRRGARNSPAPNS